MTQGLPLMEQPGYATGEYGALKFLVRQEISKINTMMIVKVLATYADDLTVDLQPLVNMVNGAGEGTQYGTIPRVPYFRLHGGINEIQIEPSVGDIGIAGFCSRDISQVKVTKDICNPGSWARYSLSDGIYFGGVMNTLTPATNFIKFDATGITIESTDGIIDLVAPSGIYANGSKIG